MNDVITTEGCDWPIYQTGNGRKYRPISNAQNAVRSVGSILALIGRKSLISTRVSVEDGVALPIWNKRGRQLRWS
jgi:hypothetical protein